MCLIIRRIGPSALLFMGCSFGSGEPYPDRCIGSSLHGLEVSTEFDCIDVQTVEQGCLRPVNLEIELNIRSTKLGYLQVYVLNPKDRYNSETGKTLENLRNLIDHPMSGNQASTAALNPPDARDPTVTLIFSDDVPPEHNSVFTCFSSGVGICDLENAAPENTDCTDISQLCEGNNVRLPPQTDHPLKDLYAEDNLLLDPGNDYEGARGDASGVWRVCAKTDVEIGTEIVSAKVIITNEGGS